MYFCHDICQESKSTDHVDYFLSGTGELKTFFFVLTPPNIGICMYLDCRYVDPKSKKNNSFVKYLILANKRKIINLDYFVLNF